MCERAGIEAAKACVAAFARHAALSKAAFLVALHAFMSGQILRMASLWRACSAGPLQPCAFGRAQQAAAALYAAGLAELAKTAKATIVR